MRMAGTRLLLYGPALQACMVWFGQDALETARAIRFFKVKDLRTQVAAVAGSRIGRKECFSREDADNGHYDAQHRQLGRIA